MTFLPLFLIKKELAIYKTTNANEFQKYHENKKKLYKNVFLVLQDDFGP